MEETRQNKQEENKMGVMPINRLLLDMSLPIMISMIVQALYNIVDSVYVAKISENALTAVSLAFPIQNLMIAIAVGTGVGVNALLSKSLGEKNFERVNKTAENAVFLAVMSYLVLLFIGLFHWRNFAGNDGAYSAGDRKDLLYNDYAGHWRDYQYYPRPDSDFRTLWISENGGCGSCGSDGGRSDCGGDSGYIFKS